MNLNKTQIYALANTFKKEIDAKLKIKNIKLREEKMKPFKVLFDKYKKLIDSNKECTSMYIRIGNSTDVSLTKTHTFKTWTEQWAFNDLLKNKFVSLHDIEQDIILATIDSKSVDDIMKVLTNKYK